MSMLKIVDLPRADDVSSAEMNKITGGMSCQDGLALADLYNTLAGIANNMGDAGNTGYFAGKSAGVREASCRG